MSSDNGIQEVEAEFDNILGKVMRHRGKHRTRYLAELKAFVYHVLKMRTEVTDKHKLLEIGNLELEIRSLRQEKKQLEDMRDHCYNIAQTSMQKLKDIEEKLAEETKQKRELEDKFKMMKTILNS